MKRKEFKYLISETTAKKIAELTAPFVSYDPYCLYEKDKSYHVYSLYFDTFKKHSFYEKLDGQGKRVKIRIRTYQQQYSSRAKLFLEFKRKYGESFIKNREFISYSLYKSIAKGNHKALLSLTSPLFQNCGIRMLSHKLQPSVFVSFKREAFFAKGNHSLRINFDRDLTAIQSSHIFNNSISTRYLTRKVIFEIKFADSVPQWLYHTIRRCNLQRESFSKYCTGLISCGKVEQLNSLLYFQ